MAYTPINTQAYTAAFSGAVAGMAVNGWITSDSGSTYTTVCSIAGAFAEAFDVAWNSATALNSLEYAAIQQACQQEFAFRGPGPLAAPQFALPATWAIPAKACATLALQCDLYFAGQGITPPPIGAGGGMFQQGNLGFPAIELSELNPSPQQAAVEVAAQSDVGSFTKVTFIGWAAIAMSVDETGSPALSDGFIRIDVAWDGVSFNPGIPQLWGGGGSQNSPRLTVPLYAFDAAGPATANPQVRIVFDGSPLGGAEALTITLDVIQASVLFSN